MHAIMEEAVSVPKVQPRGMQYKVVMHDDVTDLMRPLLVKHGVLRTTSVEGHTQDGNTTTVDLLVRYFNIDEPTDYIEVKAFGYGADQQDKGPGKAISYASKYADMKTLMLATGDDPDREDFHKTTTKPVAPAKPAEPAKPASEPAKDTKPAKPPKADKPAKPAATVEVYDKKNDAHQDRLIKILDAKSKIKRISIADYDKIGDKLNGLPMTMTAVDAILKDYYALDDKM